MEKYVGLVNVSEELLYFSALKPGVTIDNFNSFSRDYDLNGGKGILGNIAGSYRFIIYDNDHGAVSQSLRLTTEEVLSALIGYLRIVHKDEGDIDQISSRLFKKAKGKDDWLYILIFIAGFCALIGIVMLYNRSHNF